MSVALVLAASISLVIAQSNQCSVSFNADLLRPSDMRLIGGYNDVLGTVQNLTYHDQGLIETSKFLYNGIMRHPGGTVANYWYIKNATYVEPCNTTNYDYCYRKSIVDKLPPQTFNPANFSHGIGTSSAVSAKQNGNDKYANSIVWDLNVLTLYDNDLLEQVNVLNEQIGGVDSVKYVELGNEYYLNAYQWEFPNSTVYMKKALPLIQRIRTLLPSAKISVPAQREYGSNTKSAWNEGLNRYAIEYDSVTIHDYSCKGNLIQNLSATQQRQYIANYGRAIIPEIVDYVNGFFTG